MGLLHAERQLLAVLVDAQDYHVDFVADVDQFARMVDAPGPGHFADVYQAFDAWFELHECTVAHHVDDSALARRCQQGTSLRPFPMGCWPFA